MFVSFVHSVTALLRAVGLLEMDNYISETESAHARSPESAYPPCGLVLIMGFAFPRAQVQILHFAKACLVYEPNVLRFSMSPLSSIPIDLALGFRAPSTSIALLILIALLTFSGF